MVQLTVVIFHRFIKNGKNRLNKSPVIYDETVKCFASLSGGVTFRISINRIKFSFTGSTPIQIDYLINAEIAFFKGRSPINLGRSLSVNWNFPLAIFP